MSKIVRNLPKSMDKSTWTLDNKVAVECLEEKISEYSYGDRSVDKEFWYLSMFTDQSGQFSLESTEYTVYPGDS